MEYNINIVNCLSHVARDEWKGRTSHYEGWTSANDTAMIEVNEVALCLAISFWTLDILSSPAELSIGKAEKTKFFFFKWLYVNLSRYNSTELLIKFTYSTTLFNASFL